MLQSNPAGWLGGVANDVGAVTSAYPAGRFSPRVKLTANLDMYVDAAAGSDNATCLVGNPCRTIQRPFDLLRDSYDLANWVVTVHLADGSYTPGLALGTKLVGQAGPYNLILIGNEAAPQNVVIADTRAVTANLESGVGSPIFVAWGGNLSVRGVTLIASFRGAWANTFGNLLLRNMRFGPGGQDQVVATAFGQIRMDGDYVIYGGTTHAHLYADTGGVVFAYDPQSPQVIVHVTVANTPAFSSFAVAQRLSQVHAWSTNMIFSGAATGLRFFVDSNSVIGTNGAGASFLPGNAAGIATTGGIYQ